ncbi:hypothetical protein [Lederbergia lenta]|uniref:Uncharacterized protein n=1 Tax=Lederbergia lenta TaxID=1467 RepID=A0A2X4VHD8_LEDLE|nr:hypothetical protein [Lederbergia lenta]MEC2323679.1 hypothetical protein [Lederbergia lenta]SQI51646.1 Uncharacterised protein [Lederbergia lenta]
MSVAIRSTKDTPEPCIKKSPLGDIEGKTLPFVSSDHVLKYGGLIHETSLPNKQIPQKQDLHRFWGILLY